MENMVGLLERYGKYNEIYGDLWMSLDIHRKYGQTYGTNVPLF